MSFLTLRGLLLSCCLIQPMPSALGITFTWKGGGANDDWTTDENWLGGLAPLPVGLHDIELAGSIRLTPFVDTPFQIGSLTFDATAQPFVLTGADVKSDCDTPPPEQVR